MKYTGILQCIHKVLPSLSSATSLLVLIACPEEDWEVKELTPVTHNALLVQGARRENTLLRTNVSPSASTDIFVFCYKTNYISITAVQNSFQNLFYNGSEQFEIIVLWLTRNYKSFDFLQLLASCRVIIFGKAAYCQSIKRFHINDFREHQSVNALWLFLYVNEWSLLFT